MPPRRSNKENKGQSSQLSQMTLEESFRLSQESQPDLGDVTNDCVRYIVYRAGSNLPIRRTDLQSHVLKGGKWNFEAIMKLVAVTLRRVYGYNLNICETNDNGKPKTYVVSNSLPYVDSDSDSGDGENTIPSDVNKVLIMLVLTHIFMSMGSATEACLHSFLMSLGIDPEKKHEIFGNVKDYISVTMVKRKYLDMKMEGELKKVSFTWGVKAEKEISKHELLNFVTKMYRDRDPKSWRSQFEMANEQQLNRINVAENENDAMEVDNNESI